MQTLTELLPPEVGATGKPSVVGENVVLRLGCGQPAEMKHDTAVGLARAVAPRIQQGRGSTSLADTGSARLTGQRVLHLGAVEPRERRVSGRNGLVQRQQASRSTTVRARLVAGNPEVWLTTASGLHSGTVA